MSKKYINAQELLDDSLNLGLKIAKSGYQPDLIVGVWRGGTPVAIAIQELLEFIGIDNDHIAIRTASYTGINKRTKVEVHGLEYLEKNTLNAKSLLIVDDVFDTGLSVDKIITELNSIFHGKALTIKVATPYFKPGNNQTNRSPDFYLHKTDQWLVFPHEFIGLSDDEILKQKPGISTVRQNILSLKKSLR